MAEKNKIGGFGMLEIVVAIGIISSALFGLMSAVGLASRITRETTGNIQAAYLLEEGIESMRVLRDISWEINITTLNTGLPYYLYFEEGNWKATTTPNTIDGLFERKFTVQNVYRDAGGDIIGSGGVLDPNTKKITVDVSWPGRTGTTTRNISFYLTNLFIN